MRDPVSSRRYHRETPSSLSNHHRNDHHAPQHRLGHGRPLSPLSTSPTNQQHHAFTFGEKPKKKKTTVKALPSPRRPPTPELRMMMTAKKLPETNMATAPIRTKNATSRGRMMEGGGGVSRTNIAHDATDDDAAVAAAWKTMDHLEDAAAPEDWHWKPSSSTENQEPIGTLERPIELVDPEDLEEDNHRPILHHHQPHQHSKMMVPGTSIHQPIVLDTREHEILESAEYKRQRKAISKKVNQTVLPDSFSISTLAPPARNHNNHKTNKQKQRPTTKSQPPQHQQQQQPLSKKGGLLRSFFSGIGRNKKNQATGKEPKITSSYSSDLESHLPVDKATTPRSPDPFPPVTSLDVPPPEPLLFARAKISTTPRQMSLPTPRKANATKELSPQRIRNGIIIPSSTTATHRPHDQLLVDDEDDVKFLEAHEKHQSTDWSHNATADPLTTARNRPRGDHYNTGSETIPTNHHHRRKQPFSKPFDDDTTATTVSGVTNPTFALSITNNDIAEKNKKANPRRKDTLQFIDPFDVESAQFSSGMDPFLKATNSTAIPSPGEFSDVFFSAAESHDESMGGDSNSTNVVPDPPPSAMVTKSDPPIPANNKQRFSPDENDAEYNLPAHPPSSNPLTTKRTPILALDPAAFGTLSSIPAETSPSKKQTKSSTVNPISRSPSSFLAPTASARARVRERRQQQQKLRMEAAAMSENHKPTIVNDAKQQPTMPDAAAEPSKQPNQGPSKLRVRDLIGSSNNDKGTKKVARPRILPEGGGETPIKHSYHLVDPPLIKRAQIRSKIKNSAHFQENGKARQSQQQPLNHQNLHLAVSASSDNSSISLSIKRKSTSESMSSSVGSDMQRLRSILRRSRLNNNPDSVVRYTEPMESAFAVIDDHKIRDPMQRAGVRLLSAAVIPIQCAIRRHLALRHALTRMWSIVAIQTCVRRWMTHRFYQRQRQAATVIQAMYRGGSVRDQVLLEHCCAIEIQRHVRGYLASLNVCEQIYMITLVQACLRRKLAINRAMDRMVSIIQIQACSRGFLTRSLYLRKKKSACKIQALWRGFSSRFNYQLDLLDIIIVQSICRRKLASFRYVKLMYEHRVRCATLIQSHWRSYDCTMNYLHYLADVLIAQSAVRRWMARKRCHAIRERNAVIVQSALRCFFAKLELDRIRSAILIQKSWRGFSCYAEYMFTISDIVLAQSVARCWIKRKEYPILLHARRTEAATCIQKYWRRSSQVANYRILVGEHIAALYIQTSWRRFSKCAEFSLIRQSAIRIQSLSRGVSVRQILVTDHFLATLIQSAFRMYLAQKRVKTALILHNLQRGYIEVARQEAESAKTIQRLVRGTQARKMVKPQISARYIQAIWRGRIIRSSYIRYISARKIQSLWRRRLALNVYMKNVKARSIQAIWRGFIERMNCTLHKTARLIQTIWRGFSARLLLSRHLAARLIQSRCRGYISRVSVKLYLNARHIQSVWRGYTVRLSYNYFIAARLIQSTWRCKLLQKQYTRFISARRIQARWRSYFLHEAYKHYLAARKIQSVWRCFILTVAYKHFISARRIQTLWRYKHARKQYLDFLAARRIQAFWRGKSLQSAYLHYIAARRIQAFWRCKLDQLAYVHFLAARRIQTFWRCKFERKLYLDFIAARRIQTFWRCKSAHNAFKVHYSCILQRKKEDVSATRIQAFWRSKALRIAYFHYMAARRIQSLWRCYSDRRVFVLYLKAHRSARKLQTFWRCRSLAKVFREYMFANKCAVRIQCAFRKMSARKIYNRRFARKLCQENLGVVTIQRYARGYTCRREFAPLNRSVLQTRASAKSAIKIQRIWRGYYANQSYWQILGSTILIQAVIRGWTAKLHLRRIRESVLIEIRASNVIKSFLKSKVERCRFLHTVGAAMVIQTYFREWRAQKCKKEIPLVMDRAASKIQKFFLMIRAEVDREVRQYSSRKKRHKSRKANKEVYDSGRDKMDDELLENVWQTSIEPDFHQSEKIRMATEAAVNVLGLWQQPRAFLHPDITSNRTDENMALIRKGSSLSVSLASGGGIILPHGRSPQHQPPQRQPLILTSLSRRELDENWNLEEAWIDAEILDVKERRRHRMRKVKPSSTRPPETPPPPSRNTQESCL
jgi:hypothetical protein